MYKCIGRARGAIGLLVLAGIFAAVEGDFSCRQAWYGVTFIIYRQRERVGECELNRCWS